MQEIENIFGRDAFPLVVGGKQWSKKELEDLSTAEFQQLRTAWLHEQKQNRGTVGEGESFVPTVQVSADAIERAERHDVMAVDAEFVVEFRVLVPFYGTEAQIEGLEREVRSVLHTRINMGVSVRRRAVFRS